LSAGISASGRAERPDVPGILATPSIDRRGPLRPDSAFPDEILRQVLDAAPDGIAVVDASGTIVSVNQMAGTLFEYSHGELVGSSIDLLLPERARSGHARHRAEYAAHPRARSMGSGLELRGRKKSGAEFPVEISLSPLDTEGGPLVVAIIRDVTERREADEELQRVHEQLALVDDRERIARDLHDTVVQRLFAVGLSLQGALARAPADAAAERLEIAVDEIDKTIRDVRSSIFALHTRRHSEASARDEVMVTAREAARVLGFEPEIRFDGPVDTVVPDSVRDHLVATLREALSNVTKHAHASRVEIDVGIDGDELRMQVCDDGVGMGNPGSGNGLHNMRERAMAHGGDCIISTRPTGGTQIDWRVSLIARIG
jgi:two-component system sensor histidine kinase DevS